MRRGIVLLGACALLVALPIVGHAQDSTSAKPSTPAESSAPTESAPSHAKAAKAMAPKVDLNSADKDMLMKVPGLTDAMADKIIAGRPYKNRAELVSKKILTKEEYSKVRGALMVKVEKEKKAAK